MAIVAPESWAVRCQTESRKEIALKVPYPPVLDAAYSHFPIVAEAQAGGTVEEIALEDFELSEDDASRAVEQAKETALVQTTTLFLLWAFVILVAVLLGDLAMFVAGFDPPSLSHSQRTFLAYSTVALAVVHFLVLCLPCTSILSEYRDQVADCGPEQARLVGVVGYAVLSVMWWTARGMVISATEAVLTHAGADEVLALAIVVWTLLGFSAVLGAMIYAYSVEEPRGPIAVAVMLGASLLCLIVPWGIHRGGYGYTVGLEGDQPHTNMLMLWLPTVLGMSVAAGRHFDMFQDPEYQVYFFASPEPHQVSPLLFRLHVFNGCVALLVYAADCVVLVGTADTATGNRRLLAATGCLFLLITAVLHVTKPMAVLGPNIGTSVAIFGLRGVFLLCYERMLRSSMTDSAITWLTVSEVGIVMFYVALCTFTEYKGHTTLLNSTSRFTFVNELLSVLIHCLATAVAVTVAACFALGDVLPQEVFTLDIPTSGPLGVNAMRPWVNAAQIFMVVPSVMLCAASSGYKLWVDMVDTRKRLWRAFCRNVDRSVGVLRYPLITDPSWQRYMSVVTRYGRKELPPPESPVVEILVDHGHWATHVDSLAHLMCQHGPELEATNSESFEDEKVDAKLLPRTPSTTPSTELMSQVDAVRAVLYSARTLCCLHRQASADAYAELKDPLHGRRKCSMSDGFVSLGPDLVRVRDVLARLRVEDACQLWVDPTKRFRRGRPTVTTVATTRAEQKGSDAAPDVHEIEEKINDEVLCGYVCNIWETSAMKRLYEWCTRHIQYLPDDKQLPPASQYFLDHASRLLSPSCKLTELDMWQTRLGFFTGAGAGGVVEMGVNADENHFRLLYMQRNPFAGSRLSERSPWYIDMACSRAAILVYFSSLMDFTHPPQLRSSLARLRVLTQGGRTPALVVLTDYTEFDRSVEAGVATPSVCQRLGASDVAAQGITTRNLAAFIANLFRRAAFNDGVIAPRCVWVILSDGDSQHSLLPPLFHTVKQVCLIRRRSQ